MRLFNLFFGLVVFTLFSTICLAQERSFLFTFVPPLNENLNTILNYDAAYGNQTFEPLGSDNIEQNIGLQTGQKVLSLRPKYNIQIYKKERLISEYLQFTSIFGVLE